MATHRMSIVNASAIPDSTGRVFFESFTVRATNDLFRHLVLILNDPTSGQAHGIYGRFPVPKSYVSSPAIKVVWTTAATSGNVKYDFDYRAVGGDDAESLDQASFQEELTVTDTAPSAAFERMEASMSLTAANLAADDELEYFFTREDGGGTDTMAAVAIIFDVLFEWSDS